MTSLERASGAPMPSSSPVDTDAFLEAAQVHRRELLAHCYRMTGSLHDAEDLVQETYLRAWRSRSTYEGRASLRTWLYRIATNACLTARQSGVRRVLPSGLGPPEADPDAEIRLAPGATRWLEPIPDALVRAQPDDPAELVVARSTLRLALIASLQYLPGRQRAVFLLREVLAFPATDVAAMLDMTVPAVKSALQRARARFEEVALTDEDVVEPESPAARAVLQRYVDAFERADPAAIDELLRADARLEVTGSRTWFAGKTTCVPYLTRHVLLTPGEYSMRGTVANGQPATVSYRNGVPFAVVVLGTDGERLSAITVFTDPTLVDLFGG